MLPTQRLSGATGRYTPSLICDSIELRGSLDALDQFADYVAGANGPLTLLLDTLDAAHIAPYTAALRALTITPDDTTLMRATRHQDRLDIAGAAAARHLLAQNLRQFRVWFDRGTLRRNTHQHLEYFPDHPYIAPDSLPFVIMVDFPDSNE